MCLPFCVLLLGDVKDKVRRCFWAAAAAEAVADLASGFAIAGIAEHLMYRVMDGLRRGLLVDLLGFEPRYRRL